MNTYTNPEAPKKRTYTDVSEFMAEARKRHAYATQQDAKDRKAGEEDTDFVAGRQWRESVYEKRKKQKRPILTWNRLQTFVSHVVNGGRENKPAIQCSAMDGGQVHTAETIEGRMRQIEYDCDADIAYDTAREQQVVSGRGFIRVRTEYKPGTFKQRLLIEAIENQWSVLFDPAARKYDRSDADWCFVDTELSQEAYTRRFGKQTEAAKSNFFASGSNPAPDWIGCGTNGEMIHVAEYWCKEYRKRTLCLLSDISAVYRDELPEDFDEKHILDEREEDFCTVKQYVIDGFEILEETEWIGCYIPIIPVWGKQMMVKGVRRNYSLVRFAKDPQRLVNLYVSNIAEQIAQMPKAPWIGAEGQFAGREEEWKNANDDPRAYLQYKNVDFNGQPVGPPTRQVSEPPIQALTLGLNQAIDAIKSAMGIYDAALGDTSNETSGVAIQRRKKESEVANFHFSDNEARSRKHLGRILLELIPKVDKGAKSIAVRGVDGKSSQVDLGVPTKHAKTGEIVTHDLEAGSYDVAVSTGPSYHSQREQSFDAFSQLVNADPSLMQVMGDILFRNMDAPGADEIADRMAKLLPPALQEDGGDQAKQSQQLQQTNQVLQQQLDQAHAFGAELHNQIVSKQADINAKLEIARMQEDTKRTIALAQINLQEGKTLLENELDVTHRMADRRHEATLAAAKMGHDASQQAADQQHATELQNAALEQQSAQAQQAQEATPQQQQEPQSA